MKPMMAFLTLALFFASGCSTMQTQTGSVVRIGPFLPRDAENHQAWIQEKLDLGADGSKTFVFSPGEYAINDPRGLRVPSGSVVNLQGVKFVLGKDITEDGQCLLIDGASCITIRGGEIVGQRDVWSPGTNVAGIRVRGNVWNLRVFDTTFRDLTGNAIGVFGIGDDEPIRDVIVKNVIGIDCCNFYGDYLQDNKGPAPGSDRKDQGTVAFYHVDGWYVEGCRFEKSQSDGTHFYHSHNGTFVNNVVADSQMGGYFLEGCENVLASDNRIVRNGSRGVTIERDSRFCTLDDNLVAFSGREGLWAPDISGVLVTGNIFRENGQKDDGEKDCEIRMDDGERYETVTKEIVISNNLIFTAPHQTAAIFFGPGVGEQSITGNQFYGDAPKSNQPGWIESN